MQKKKVAKGASIYDVRNIFGFFDPLPLVTVTNQLILFLLTAFWGSLPPHTADIILVYGSPLSYLAQKRHTWLRQHVV